VAGSLCISIDVELGWGIWDKPNPQYHRRCIEREAHIVESLLTQFVERDIAATWAIVGRLLERDEAPLSSTLRNDKLWFAPELVESIRGARVRQDIGSHGYAHIYFGEASREELRADLLAAKRVHDRHGLSLDSFVFPRNQVAHLDLLREIGVRVFRSIDHGWFMDVRNTAGRLAGRIAHLADNLLPLAPRTVIPRRDSGLTELPSSMLLLARNGLRQAIPPRVTISKAKRGLDAAARDGNVFHLWFHPSNFYFHTKERLETLGVILDHATALRSNGRLAIKPMSSFAAQ
jgi:peptidoglycan/xylan/chitin deacetylase (PgdA/CDA1 family)